MLDFHRNRYVTIGSSRLFLILFDVDVICNLWINGKYLSGPVQINVTKVLIIKDKILYLLLYYTVVNNNELKYIKEYYLEIEGISLLNSFTIFTIWYTKEHEYLQMPDMIYNRTWIYTIATYTFLIRVFPFKALDSWRQKWNCIPYLEI